MVFVILSWQKQYAEDVAVVAYETGKALVFNSHKEAQEYADANLNFNWQIVVMEL